MRNANAFLAAEVHIVGERRWNRRGAMVTDRYQHVRHHPTLAEFAGWAGSASLPVVGVDNLPGYLNCLRTRPGECAALLQDLLISVTNFFRDPECFHALEMVPPGLVLITQWRPEIVGAVGDPPGPIDA